LAVVAFIFNEVIIAAFEVNPQYASIDVGVNATVVPLFKLIEMGPD